MKAQTEITRAASSLMGANPEQDYMPVLRESAAWPHQVQADKRRTKFDDLVDSRVPPEEWTLELPKMREYRPPENVHEPVSDESGRYLGRELAYGLPFTRTSDLWNRHYFYKRQHSHRAIRLALWLWGQQKSANVIQAEIEHRYGILVSDDTVWKWVHTYTPNVSHQSPRGQPPPKSICKYCGTKSAIKAGVRKNLDGLVQVYKCLKCNRKFVIDPKPFRFTTKKTPELLNQVIALRSAGLGYKRISEELSQAGINIAWRTIGDWLTTKPKHRSESS